jgi:Family of unknown function (DUF6370)
MPRPARSPGLPDYPIVSRSAGEYIPGGAVRDGARRTGSTKGRFDVMKTAFRALLCLAVVFAVTLAVRAQEDKKAKPVKKTLKGELVCGKCKLSETDKCSNVLVVKEGEKEVNYFIQDKGKGEKYHVCTGSKKAEVTGMVSKKDDKMIITKATVKILKD